MTPELKCNCGNSRIRVIHDQRQLTNCTIENNEITCLACNSKTKLSHVMKLINDLIWVLPHYVSTVGHVATKYPGYEFERHLNAVEHEPGTELLPLQERNGDLIYSPDPKGTKIIHPPTVLKNYTLAGSLLMLADDVIRDIRFAKNAPQRKQLLVVQSRNGTQASIVITMEDWEYVRHFKTKFTAVRVRDVETAELLFHFNSELIKLRADEDIVYNYGDENGK